MNRATFRSGPGEEEREPGPLCDCSRDPATRKGKMKPEGEDENRSPEARLCELRRTGPPRLAKPRLGAWSILSGPHLDGHGRVDLVQRSHRGLADQAVLVGGTLHERGDCPT